MHFAFIPYGERRELEILFRDMESQKHKMPMTKGKQKKTIWINGHINQLPFGVYEYIAPKESKDIIMTSLEFDTAGHSEARALKNFLPLIRKFLKLDKIPKFDKGQKYLWIRENVAIIPLGIREDGDIVGKHEMDKGWTHEAI